MQSLILKVLTTAAVGLLTAGTGTVRAALLDFEDVAVSPGLSTFDINVTSGGFYFESSRDHLHRANDVSDRAADGTTVLWIHNNASTEINLLTMSPIGGGTFSLNSARFAGIFADITSYNATSVVITGNIFGGGTVTATVSLDGIIDGPGGADDFQSYTFAGWNNLTSVEFYGAGGDTTENAWSMDGLTVNAAVPEPSTYLAGALLALVFGVQGVRSLRRRKQTA